LGYVEGSFEHDVMRADDATDLAHLGVIWVGALAGFYGSASEEYVDVPSQLALARDTLVLIEDELQAVLAEIG
jgi:hypothetical protein